MPGLKEGEENMNKKRFKCRNLNCGFEWETDLDIDQYPDVCPKCLTEFN